jgi:4-carboxymuconolactone decarboxylase
MTERRKRTIAAGLSAALLAVSSTSMAQNRLPAIPAEQMTEAQKKAAAEFTAARGLELSGPFVVLLRSPDLLNRVRAMGDYLRYNSALPPRLSEFVILIVARQWSQGYEWGAHYPSAVKAGIRPDVIDAIAHGRRPERLDQDQQILYDLCSELQRNQNVSDGTYGRAVAAIGERGVIDAVSITGYYTLLAMVLNTSRTPPAPDAPVLPALPK